MRAFSTRQNSFGSIDRAGQQLVSLTHSDPARDSSLDIVNNWRACHTYPLQVIRTRLTRRAKAISSSEPLVAQRIKRLPSIILKLAENSTRLTQMQDIGGCRAVLNDVDDVDRLVEMYAKRQTADRDNEQPFCIRKTDYIAKPKTDGYRSVHLIMQFQATDEKRKSFNGQKIEIQIRSKLQHAWATALETCQTFTKQALKSKVKSAEAHWLKFFSWTSSAIAANERRPIVPETTTDSVERRTAINHIIQQKKIVESFEAWTTMLSHHAPNQNAAAYLLELNTLHRGNLSITGFGKTEMRDAQAKYLEREKATEGDKFSQVVLVSAGSLENLKKAYPNYYLDTTDFLEAIKSICQSPGIHFKR